MISAPDRFFNLRGWWPGMVQFVLFAGVLVSLALNCYTHASIEIRRPIILCIASFLAMPRLRNAPRVTMLQNIALLYCIGVMFNQAALRFLHLQMGRTHLEVSLAFILLLPLALQYLICKLRSSPSAPPDESDLHSSWYLLVIILLVHLLLLFIALKSVYGYGYEYSPAVLAALCLYFLVFLFTCEALRNKWYARTTALVCSCLWAFLCISQVS